MSTDANNEPGTRGSRAIVPPPPGFLCRITNPSKRPRMIYDGITNAEAIRIEPGQKVERVLSMSVIERLQEQEHADPEDPDLKVEELGPAPVALPAQRTARKPVAARTGE